MQCPNCQGTGTTPRPEHTTQQGQLPYVGAHHTTFPKLCDRCSGSGELPAAKPATEGARPAPAT